MFQMAQVQHSGTQSGSQDQLSSNMLGQGRGQGSQEGLGGHILNHGQGGNIYQCEEQGSFQHAHQVPPPQIQFNPSPIFRPSDHIRDSVPLSHYPNSNQPSSNTHT